jgi:hypothetical protein
MCYVRHAEDPVLPGGVNSWSALPARLWRARKCGEGELEALLYPIRPSLVVFDLCSAIKPGGIDRRASQTRTGSTITSSRYPSTGMKSGMRSIGETAYATAAPSNHRVRRGARGSIRTRRYTSISFLNCRTSVLIRFILAAAQQVTLLFLNISTARSAAAGSIQ